MRLDKFLKVSRLIKRRTVAKDIASSNKIYVNDKLAKPSTILKVDDIIKIIILDKETKFKVLSLSLYSNKNESKSMYEILE